MLVPFARELKQGNAGKDVIAVKRALAKAGFLKWSTKPSPFFGPYLSKTINKANKKHGLPQNGKYTLALHKILVKAGRFDAYGAWLMGERVKNQELISEKTKEQKMRQKIVNAAMLGYNNRDSINYTQGSSRMEGVTKKIKPPQFPRYADCSAFATWCYWVAGAPDPNKRGYDGYGYTGTQTDSGRVIQFSQIKPGDLIFYGGSSKVPAHVAIYVGSGRVVSHGSQSGPLLLEWNYRPVNHIRSYI